MPSRVRRLGRAPARSPPLPASAVAVGDEQRDERADDDDGCFGLTVAGIL